MGLTEAYKQAGFSAKNAVSNALVLSRKPLVASRIDTLRAQASSGALSRDQILQLLSNLAQAGRSEQTQLKAAELLCRMQGYAEPERVTHQHQHLHVDAGLIEQLRGGYAALVARGARGARGAEDPQGEAQQAGGPPNIERPTPTPTPTGEVEIIHTTP